VVGFYRSPARSRLFLALGWRIKCRADDLENHTAVLMRLFSRSYWCYLTRDGIMLLASSYIKVHKINANMYKQPKEALIVTCACKTCVNPI